MKIKTIVFYILVFSGSLSVFLVILFPGKKAACLLSECSQNSSNYFHCTDIRPCFPFCLEFKNAGIVISGMKFEPDMLKIRLSGIPLPGHDAAVKITAESGRGCVNAATAIAGVNPLKCIDPSVSASGIRIRDFRYRAGQADISADAVLDIELDASGLWPGHISAARGTIRATKTVINLKNSLLNRMGMSGVRFSSIIVRFIKKKNKIIITECSAQGSAIHLAITGNIITDIFPDRTRLNLKGLVFTDSSAFVKFAGLASVKASGKDILREGIKFSITGTLKNPEIKI